VAEVQAEDGAAAALAAVAEVASEALAAAVLVAVEQAAVGSKQVRER
jgi:hypothetical protein